LRQSKEGDEVIILARARTYKVALMLGALGRGSMVRFLHEAGLIGKYEPVVDMAGIHLKSANLRSAEQRISSLPLRANRARAPLQR
jgi:hypothetical protein